MDATLSYPQDGHARYLFLEDGSYWFGHRNRVIVDALRRHPFSGLLLDVGGGNGYVTRRLLDEGFDAALLEPGPVGAGNARSRRGIPRVIQATLEEAGLAPASLGAAGCFDVLEHVEEDAAMAERIHRLLLPGGLLFATLPARRWLWSGADAAAGHFRRYARRDVLSMLGSRFDLIEYTYFFGPLVLPVLLARVLPWRLGFRGGALSPEAEHGTGGGPAVRILAALLRREADRLAAGATLRLGTSCLVVARKREAGHG